MHVLEVNIGIKKEIEAKRKKEESCADQYASRQRNVELVPRLK